MADVYEAAILEQVKTGPKTMSEIVQVTKKNEKTLNKRARSLVQEGILCDAIIEVGTERGFRLVHLYYFPQDEKIIKSGRWEPIYLRFNASLHTCVKEAILTLMKKNLYYPTIEEIAREVRVNPNSKELKDAIYAVAKEVEWRPPADEELALVRSVTDRVTLLAKYIEKGIEKEWLKFCTEEEIKKAKNPLYMKIGDKVSIL